MNFFLFVIASEHIFQNKILQMRKMLLHRILIIFICIIELFRVVIPEWW